MNQNLILGVVLFILAIGAVTTLIGGYLPSFLLPPSLSPAPVPPPEPDSGPRRKISMTPEGFSPSNLTIRRGDTVVFENNDTRQRWPASALHPVHQVCLGFDALRPLDPGESYEYTFAENKNCPFHDHLFPNLLGRINVTD